MRVLPVCLAAAVATGTALGLWTPIAASVGVAGLIAALSATAISLARGNGLDVLCRALGGFLIGAWALSSAGERLARDPPLLAATRQLPPPVVLEGRLLSDAVPDGDALRLQLDVTRVGGTNAAVAGTAALTVGGSIARGVWPTWRAGRLVTASASVGPLARYLDVGVADDRLALARRGLVLAGSVKSGALVDVLAPGSRLKESAARFRAFVRRAIDRHVGVRDPVAGAVTTAILIGDRTGLDVALEDRLQRAGTYHVIAISGGNIAIFAATLVGLARVIRCPLALAYPLVALALWGYASLVGGGASVLRATAMASAYLLLRALDLRAAPFAALAAATATLLIAEPRLSADAGFLLTVGATAAIVGLTPVLMASRRWPRGVRACVAVAMASIATEAVLLPVSAALFGRVTFAGPLLNLCAVPAMALVQQAGLGVLIATTWVPALADCAGALAAFGAQALVGSSTLVDWVPALARRVPSPSWHTTCLYFAAGAMMLSAPVLTSLPGRRRVQLRRMGAGAALLAAVWVVWHPGTWRMPWRGDGRLHVTSIDVGQGDATLIELPDATTVLVDTGGLGVDARFDIGARVVAPALWARGIGWLDALVLTHGDPDHIGGAPTVIDLFEPPIVWDGVVVPSHTPMRALRDRARGQGLAWQTLRSGQRWQRAGVTFIVWNPPAPDWERRKVRNDDSIVIELRYGDVSVILPGDIGRAVEGELVHQVAGTPFRVLKVPHHGSASSSSDEFLGALRPSIALVSCGRENRFGHPAPAVLARYAAHRALVFRTDRDGEIDLTTDGRQVDVVTFTGRHYVTQAGPEGRRDAVRTERRLNGR